MVCCAQAYGEFYFNGTRIGNSLGPGGSCLDSIAGDRITDQTDLVQLDATARLKLMFTLPEHAVQAVRPGQPVEARVAPFPDRTFPGTVFFVAPSLDPRNRRLTAKAAIDNPERLLTICLLLFVGAVGKSAQFPLHVWLPDAMEGPTPVSALIHAATMVTAGVYMVARCTPLFMLAPEAQMTVAGIGAITALLAALIALTQNDLKRVLAYSTVSQLGYMMMADFPLYEPRTWLHPAGFVAMGHGLPAALGAKAAFPDRAVVAVLGDGCFQMCGLELATAVQEELPVVVVVVNDGSLTLIKAIQQRKYDNRFLGVDLKNPDFGLFAQAFGVRHWRVNSDESFELALTQAVKSGESALIEITIPSGNSAI